VEIMQLVKNFHGGNLSHKVEIIQFVKDFRDIIRCLEIRKTGWVFILSLKSVAKLE